MLPRDFLDEVERELLAARVGLAEGEDRLAALRELHRLVLQIVSELGRPVTVFDVIRREGDRDERLRRLRLVRSLRSPS